MAKYQLKPRSQNLMKKILGKSQALETLFLRYLTELTQLYLG